MIDVKEHVYDDDPRRGPADVRTVLPGVRYYFVGNGLILAAVQAAPDGEGTPLGLVLMNPERLGQKREALTMDANSGLAATRLSFEAGPGFRRKIECLRPSLSWSWEWGIPAVRAAWKDGPLEVMERFFCPDRSKPNLIRDVSLANSGRSPLPLRMRTGVKRPSLKTEMTIEAGGRRSLALRYSLVGPPDAVELDVIDGGSLSPAESREYWGRAAALSFQSPLLDHFFRSALGPLADVLSASGKVDAGIWQYGREWVRDHSFMAMGLTVAGQHRTARLLLQRLLREFVSPQGDCIDSSERRAPDDVELDQNGVLLHALNHYLAWTGDRTITADNWDKIKATAEFPLHPVFRHRSSGLLFNSRDYWERHAAHGIEPGIELMYQVYPSLGLRAAAEMARTVGAEDDARRWEAESDILKEAVLRHPRFALVDRRGLIKRRDTDGAIRETIRPRADSGLPAGVPLADPGIPHYLRPDSSAAMALALGFLDPTGPVAKATLEDMEVLWNQAWEGGGYGRFHASSEADSAGPWPVASLFIARAHHRAGNFDKVWRVLRWLESFPGAGSGAFFEMDGPRISPPYAQIGILPWTWAEMIQLLVVHILGVEVTGRGLRFQPRLLPGMGDVRGSLPWLDGRIHIRIRQRPGLAEPAVRCDAEGAETTAGGLIVPPRGGDVSIEADVP
jgi:hypothetical protein